MFIKAYALPRVSMKEKQAFQKNMTLHFYAIGTSFQRNENVHLKDAIKTVRPDGRLMLNQKQLATNSLHKCHLALMVRVKERMLGATAFLETDRWTNIRNEAVGNYMFVSLVYSMYLVSVQTG